MMQTCTKCNSSWNGVELWEKCPFCGEPLKGKVVPVFSSVQEVFQYLLQQYGIDFLYNHRMPAYMGDLAPQFKEEIRLVRIGVESGAYQTMISMNDKAPEERIKCFYREKERIKHVYYLDSVWAERVLLWLSDTLSWGILSVNSADKEKTAEKKKEKIVFNGNAGTALNSVQPLLDRVFLFFERRQLERG